FFAQDYSRRCGQELRNSGRAPGRSAEGNFRSRQRHPCTFGKPEWRSSSRQIKSKKIGAKPPSIAKAATRFALDSTSCERGHRSHWLRVVAASVLHKFGYDIYRQQGILKQEKHFLDGRQL